MNDCSRGYYKNTDGCMAGTHVCTLCTICDAGDFTFDSRCDGTTSEDIKCVSCDTYDGGYGRRE